MTSDAGDAERVDGAGGGEAAGERSAAGDDTRPRHAGVGSFAKPWFWIPVLPLLALDLLSKSAVFAWHASRFPRLGNDEIHVLEGPIWFSLVRYYNTGTVWGLAQDFTGTLIGLRIVALFVLVWFASRTPSAHRLRQFVLGMILAGAAGNLWDNLTVDHPVYAGGVRDFLLFYVKVGGVDYTFPAFNVADSCITVGAITLAILLWREDQP